jgi:hypothetical protein
MFLTRTEEEDAPKAGQFRLVQFQAPELGVEQLDGLNKSKGQKLANRAFRKDGMVQGIAEHNNIHYPLDIP